MVDLDVIKPVQKPTDWVNGLIVVEKPKFSENIPEKFTDVWYSLRLISFQTLAIWNPFSSEVFWREVTSAISDVPGSANSQDDFIVWGETLQEHDICLRKVFLR